MIPLLTFYVFYYGTILLYVDMNRILVLNFVSYRSNSVWSFLSKRCVFQKCLFSKGGLGPLDQEKKKFQFHHGSNAFGNY